MITKVLKNVFGTRNDRELKRMGKVVKQINALAEDIKALSDEPVSYTHLTLPTIQHWCRSRWSPYH